MKKYNIELKKDEILKICTAIESNIQNLEDYITEYLSEQEKFDKKGYKYTKKEIRRMTEIKEKLQQNL